MYTEHDEEYRYTKEYSTVEGKKQNCNNEDPGWEEVVTENRVSWRGEERGRY